MGNERSEMKWQQSESLKQRVKLSVSVVLGLFWCAPTYPSAPPGERTLKNRNKKSIGKIDKA